MTTQPVDQVDDVDVGFRDLVRAIVRLDRKLTQASDDLAAAEGTARSWRIEAEAAAADRDLQLQYVGDLQVQLADAQTQVQTLTDKLATVRADRRALYDQLVAEGIDPVWKPSTTTGTTS